MLWSSPVCLVCNGHCTLVAFLRIGVDENRAAIFDVQHKSISLPKVPIQQNFALKCNPAELLCGVGHLNGAKALQVAANSGGVGDDKGVLPLRERIQQFVDAVCHPGADLTEGLAVRIFEVRVFVLAFPERSVLPGRIAGAALGKAGVLPDGKPQQLCGLERTQRRGRPDERNRHFERLRRPAEDLRQKGRGRGWNRRAPGWNGAGEEGLS